MLATNEVIQTAPVIYIRAFDPSEFMHDVDTASLATLDDGQVMTAAGAWLTAQRQQASAPSSATTALPPGRS